VSHGPIRNFEEGAAKNVVFHNRRLGKGRRCSAYLWSGIAEAKFRLFLRALVKKIKPISMIITPIL
jgi:hypothetical protein